MEMIYGLIDLFAHLDKHLDAIIRDYGTWTYAILFAILFCETGLVVTPFLPGDSLLFAVGTLAGLGSLNISWTFPLLTTAVVCGDNVNYWIGYHVGPRVFSSEHVRWLNRKHLDRTHAFFEKHGAKTIIYARFVPFVRTFTPFVAGIGRMPYLRFLRLSVLACLLWLSVCLMGGYFFGSLPLVKRNFSLVILAIIFISTLPAVVEAVRAHRQ